MKVIQNNGDELEMTVDEFIKKKEIQKQKSLKTFKQFFMFFIFLIISVYAGFGMIFILFFNLTIIFEFFVISIIIPSNQPEPNPNTIKNIILKVFIYFSKVYLCNQLYNDFHNYTT